MRFYRITDDPAAAFGCMMLAATESVQSTRSMVGISLHQPSGQSRARGRAGARLRVQCVDGEADLLKLVRHELPSAIGLWKHRVLARHIRFGGSHSQRIRRIGDMVGIWKSVFGFLRTNALPLASAFIATMSLFVALMSLRATITAQREDREHKELLIRPALNIEAEVRDFSIIYRNYGLGPALITETLFFDGRCHVVTDKNLGQFLATEYTDVTSHFATLFIRQFETPAWQGNWQAQRRFTGHLPIPSQIIGVGQEFILFRLEGDYRTEALQKLTVMTGETQRTINEQFVRRAFSMPFAFRYCSMSEKFCFTPPLNDIPCQF